MAIEDKIDIDIFKAVNRAIGESDNLELMAAHLAQLLVGTLEIKGCTLFVLDPGTGELEVLASFGLSPGYMNKGPVLFSASVHSELKREPIVVCDIAQTDRLQYPQQAVEEGIAAIVSVPIVFNDKSIGVLRLYHHAPWEVSERDLDSLAVLAENVGLAMMYTRLHNAMGAMKHTINEVHDVWLNP